VRFSEHLLAGPYSYAYGLAAADLDGDGDLDVTSQDVVGSSANRAEPTVSSFSWFENDGRGSFRRHFIHRDEPGWFERHAVGDINGDGRPDVAVVNNRDGHILWLASGADPTKPWARHVITTTCTRAYDVALADFDEDGDLDAVAAGYASSRITWYENPGPAGWDREWVGRVLDDKMPEARTIAVCDFNRDGRVDVFAAAVGAENVPPEIEDVRQHGSRITWYENPGRPAEREWTRHVIDDRSRGPIHGHPADVDGDGDLDVVMALGMREALVPASMHQVVWYENEGSPGSGKKWTKHAVGPLPSAFEAVAVDLDADGDVDIVATAWSKGDRVVWFENSGDPRGAWTQHVIRSGWNAANQVIVADLDGDGRLDLAATADNGSSRINYKGANELRWWRNDGAR